MLPCSERQAAAIRGSKNEESDNRFGCFARGIGGRGVLFGRGASAHGVEPDGVVDFNGPRWTQWWTHHDGPGHSRANAVRAWLRTDHARCADAWQLGSHGAR
jgi:hypothetical protein